MEAQQFILTNYINNSTDTSNDSSKKSLLEKLKDNGINSRDYEDLNLTILYNKYDTRNKSPLQMECRSTIIERDTNKIVCYSCPTPLYNIDAINYMWRNPTAPKEAFVCYEGTLLSVFNNNNKWYVASRKNIYSVDTSEQTKQTEQTPIEIKSSYPSHIKMFMDVLHKDGYSDFDSFTNKLDCLKTYHFVLIHHMNENVVNYTKMFGEMYTKLCFISSRSSSDMTEYKLEEVASNIISDNIFLPTAIVDYTTYDNKESQNINEEPASEGIIIKIKDKLLKIQNSSYQFYKAIGSEKNMYRGFISLYQNNSLKSYFENNTNSEKFRKIVNPMKTNESYDTIGMIDALFKVCTSELFFLFNSLYDMKLGTQLNNDLYKLLPDDYKNIMYNLRGIAFSNKKKNKDYDNYLSIKDVYNFLKSYDIRLFEKFIRSRKLMLNWIRIDKNNELGIFSKSLWHSDKVYYKLSSIYTIKMFPEIMSDDIPILTK